MKRPLAILVLALTVSGSALAQDATTSEFDRVSGGQIEAMTKAAVKPLSGSLSVSTGQRYEATLGGEVLKDRLWFFGAASQYQALQFSSQLPAMEPMNAKTFDAKLSAQLGDRHHLSGSFSTGRNAVMTMWPSLVVEPFPSNFLSLHYTGVVSENMFFTGSLMKR
jgi:hypothetical protein